MKILCFGDGNTWGLKEFGVRYDENTRWTKQMQSMLGEGHTVIEDGLFGRTIDSLQEEATNPKRFLYRDIMKHYPYELLIISLGTADLMASLHLTPEDITKGMKTIIEAILGYEYADNGSAPKIILTSVPYVKEGMVHFKVKYGLNNESIAKSKELLPLYESLANELGLYFFDTNKYITNDDISDEDCIHFDPQGHSKFANAMVEFIKSNIL